MMTIYTAITGNYDLLKEPPESSRQGLNFEAFLDREQLSQTWKVKPATSTFSHPRLNAKYHKVLSHISCPDSEFSFWIDGSIEICVKTSVLNLADRYLADSDLAVFAHSDRYCLYQEAAVCIRRGKDDPKKICPQICRYTQEGFPANYGLAESGILLRRNTKQVKDFNELWWSEILAGSIRDQISFPYVAWKTRMKINYISGAIHRYVKDDSIFLLRQHSKKDRCY